MGSMMWHIGDVIRKRREALGMTQKELAARAHVRPNTLGDLERYGVRDHATLRKVMRALGTTEQALYRDLPDAQAVPQAAQTELTADETNILVAFRALDLHARAMALPLILAMIATVPTLPATRRHHFPAERDRNEHENDTNRRTQ